MNNNKEIEKIVISNVKEIFCEMLEPTVRESLKKDLKKDMDKQKFMEKVFENINFLLTVISFPVEDNYKKEIVSLDDEIYKQNEYVHLEDFLTFLGHDVDDMILPSLYKLKRRLVLNFEKKGKYI